MIITTRRSKMEEAVEIVTVVVRREWDMMRRSGIWSHVVKIDVHGARVVGVVRVGEVVGGGRVESDRSEGVVA